MSHLYQQISQPSEKYDDVLLLDHASTSSSATLLESDDVGHAPCQCRTKTRLRRLWPFHACLFLTYTAMFILACAMSVNTSMSTQAYFRRFSAWSPAAEAVEYRMVKYDLNDTAGLGSPYVGYGPEVDKAWLAITNDVGDQMIDLDEIGNLRMPETSVKVTHPKTGKAGYRVGLEVIHQLHCVDTLRHASFETYQNDANATVAREHIDHCLEVLRFAIQCSSEVNVFAFYLHEGDPHPWPELNSWHQCRNFDKIRDWAIENSIGLPD